MCVDQETGLASLAGPVSYDPDAVLSRYQKTNPEYARSLRSLFTSATALQFSMVVIRFLFLLFYPPPANFQRNRRCTLNADKHFLVNRV